jgi:uncharacterized membrane protein YjjP (DUF1212 family)
MSAPAPLIDPAAVAFVVKLARSLHEAGVSAFRLEDTVLSVGRRMGVELHVFSMPTGIVVAFGPPERQTTHLLRVEPGSFHLDKLVDVDAVADAVAEGTMGPVLGSARLDEIAAEAPRYGPLSTVPAYALASGALSVFLQAGWLELTASTVVGLMTGLLSIAADRGPAGGRVFAFTAAAVAAFVATAAGIVMGPLSAAVVTASGLIVLMPGLTLTTAMNELANRHLIAGTARFAGAAVVLLALTFGTAVGRAAAAGLLPTAPASVEPASLPAWVQVPALVPAALALIVLFQARMRDVPAVIAGMAVATWTTAPATRMLGSAQLGVFAGAMITGVACNLYGRLLRRSPLIPLIPGITMLVPGVVGYRSFASLLEQNVQSGVSSAFAMSLTAIALVAGLLFSNVVAPVRKTL